MADSTLHQTQPPDPEMKRVLPVYLVDAFVHEQLRGNAAGVCYLMEPRDENWMQLVAAELNQAETAFFSHQGDEFHLRWFTPVTEVDLCGHATLASAHVVWNSGLVPEEETIRFQTRSGILTAAKRGEWIELSLPADPPVPVDPPDGLWKALGARGGKCYGGRDFLLVEFPGESDVTTLAPDMGRLGALPYKAVCVTAPVRDKEYDFVSRFFAPSIGIPEDPVTGAAHCMLAPFWCRRFKKEKLTGYQASERGGLIKVTDAGERTLLSGKAITSMQGVLLL